LPVNVGLEDDAGLDVVSLKLVPEAKASEVRKRKETPRNIDLGMIIPMKLIITS
jgi:hypothetical protein